MTKVTRHSGSAGSIAFGSIAFRLTDESANALFEPGWFALVNPKVDRDPLAHEVGSLVVIERVRDGLIERSMRRIAKKTKAGCELTCHSTVRRYQRDRVIVPTKGETVKVVGIVVGGSFDIDEAA
jgi:hypothetical protein